MDNLDEIINKIETEIDEKNQVKEVVLRLSRSIVINCRKSIQKMHQNKLLLRLKNGRLLNLMTSVRDQSGYETIILKDLNVNGIMNMIHTPQGLIGIVFGTS